MAETLVQGAALVGLVVIGIIFIAEMRKWRSITSIIGRRQRLLRIWLLVLIEALFVMMFIGPWITRRQDPIAGLLYWTTCLAIGLAVVVLALVDLREVTKEYARQNRRLFRDLKGDEEHDQ